MVQMLTSNTGERSAEALDALASGLRNVSRRIGRRLLWKAVLQGVCVGAVTAVTLRCLYDLVPALRRVGLSSESTVGFSIVAMLAFLLVAMLQGRLLAPSSLRLARQADDSFGLSERLSTAVEVHSATNLNSAVSPLLYQDAVEKAGRVDLGELVKVPLFWRAALACVLLAVAGAMQFSPVVTKWGGRPQRLPDVASIPEGAPASQITVSDVREAVALVAQDAIARSDARLGTLATSLKDLLTKMQGGDVSAGDVAREVSVLRVQLRQAYGQGPTAVASGGGTRANSKSDQRGQPGSDEPQQAQRGSPDNGGRLGTTTSQARGAPRSQEAPTSLSDLVRQLELGAPGGGGGKGPAPMNPLGHQPNAGFSEPGQSPYVDPAQVALARRMNALLERPGQSGGQPIGAAQHASKGPGDAAGNGAQPLNDGSAAADKAGPIDTSGAKVVLPQNVLTQGDRIQLDVAPQTERTSVVDVAPGQAVAGAKASETAYPVGPIVDEAQRGAIGRYFLPMNGVGAGSSTVTGGSNP